MKIYLSGPMTGLPELNYPEFNRVAQTLRKSNNVVYNPAEWASPTGPGFDIRKAFADYSRFICEQADAIYLLDGWEKSQGARCEKALAEVCGISVMYQQAGC